MDVNSETEMADLIKQVWLSQIGSLLYGKENRTVLNKQRKTVTAEEKQPCVMGPCNSGTISARTC